MKITAEMSDNFTVEDIRRLRDDFAKRHTDENGKIDWDKVFAETEKGSKKILAEITRIRAESSKMRQQNDTNWS